MFSDKIITMCFYNRLEESIRTLRALRYCEGIEDYHVIACCEPGHPEVISVVEDYSQVISMDIIYNVEKLGLATNTFEALKRGFKQAGYVIHLEDDVVLAPDALKFFEWAESFGRDKDIFAVSAFSKAQPAPDKCSDCAWIWPWMGCWGWATWADRWGELRGGWPHDTDEWGWYAQKVRGDRGVIIPVWSRSQHIGRDGVHTRSEKFVEETKLFIGDRPELCTSNFVLRSPDECS